MFKAKKIDTFGNRLEYMLEKRDIKKVDFAKMLGVNKSVISRYTSGTMNPRFNVLQQMAAILQCTEIFLMGYDVPEQPVSWNPDTQEIVVETTHPLTDDEMNLIVEICKKTDSKARLLAYAKKLKELNDMEGGD